jgi:mycofactocin system glycosyltransferase
VTAYRQSLLPVGTEVRLNGSTRRFMDGATLLGGSPPRLVRLRKAPQSLLETGRLVTTDSASATLADRLLDIGIADIVLDSVPPIPLDQLTVVVPVYGASEPLDRLLSALQGVRTIVVDDASPDAEGIARVAETHSATLLRLSVNSGPAAARNLGLRHVKTPFVAFCDSDTVASGKALVHLLRHFHDQRVAIAAPRIVDLKDGVTRNWITRYEAVRSSLDLGSTSGVVRPHSRVGWIPSACFVARVDALDVGFDESMRMGEDVDLVWRLVEQGWLVRFDADVTAAHEPRHSVRAWLGRKYSYGTSAADLAERHGKAVAPAVLSPAFAVMNAALLAQRRWSFATAAVAFIFQVRRVRRQLGPVDRRPTLALELCARGASDSARQVSTQLLRTWWPITLLAALRSQRGRRAFAVAAMANALADWRTSRPDLDIARFAISRQLDDAAYGLGTCAGARRQRSIRSLLPQIQVSRRS